LSRDAYHIGPDEVGHDESFVARLGLLGADSSQVLVATKGGHLRHSDGSRTLNGSPGHLRQAAVASRSTHPVQVRGPAAVLVMLRCRRHQSGSR